MRMIFRRPRAFCRVLFRAGKSRTRHVVATRMQDTKNPLVATMATSGRVAR